MRGTDFRVRMGSLSGEEIAGLARSLRQEHHSADGEVAWWRATLAVSGCLRRRHRTREASAAAHAVTQAVQVAAERAGIAESSRSDVTLVARSAADVARALVAMEAGAGWVPALEQLLAPWGALTAA